MRVAHLPQRHGINEVDVARDERGECFFGIIAREFPQQVQVVVHLSSIHLRRRGKVTDYFCGGRFYPANAKPWKKLNSNE
ncbi:MAG TPA: hypothetical protein VK810_00660 [Dongiaceae bacterium]|nr:hypothetical protein [Dongiaceae bacterium]